jgi:hypothetical protein
MSYCNQAAKILGEQNVSCCTSCHDDDDSGYGSMCLLKLDNNTYVEVCCAKANALEKKTPPTKTGEGEKE